MEAMQTEPATPRTGLILAFALVYAILTLAKLPGSPIASAFSSWLSLADLPKHMQKHVEFILFVPLSSVIVTLFRLTLGIKMFSFFRPILIALAFDIMGIQEGLLFLIAVLAVVALGRPLLRGVDYYARIPTLLGCVVLLMVLALLGGKWWLAHSLSRLAYFPIIALCLTCESFAKALDKQGTLEAVWLAGTTAVAGMVITGVSSIPGLRHALLRFPELLFAEIACVLLIGKFLDRRLLEGKNLLALAWVRIFALRAPSLAPIDQPEGAGQRGSEPSALNILRSVENMPLRNNP